MAHVVLLGDSIFDNGKYTLGEPDVISHLRKSLPAGWSGSLVAVDGSTTADVIPQLKRIASDASYLVLSVGGNDAIMSASILNSPADSTTHALRALSDLSRSFEERYRRTVQACRELGLPLAVCTIYNGCFPDPEYQRLISTALMVFNDVILRVAVEYGLAVIDLRFVCTDPADYANPIEPSSLGGANIARAIVDLLTGVSMTRAYVIK